MFNSVFASKLMTRKTSVHSKFSHLQTANNIKQITCHLNKTNNIITFNNVNNLQLIQQSAISSLNFGLKPKKAYIPTITKSPFKYFGKRKIKFPLSFNFLENKTLWVREELPEKEPKVKRTAEENRAIQLTQKINNFSRIYDMTENDNKKIFVNNIPFFLTEKELKRTLETPGQVKAIIYHRDINGAFLGTAVAEYATEESKNYALQTFNRHYLDQRKINAKEFERNATHLQLTPYLIVTNLPNDANVARNAFSNFGEIVNVTKVKPLGKADRGVVRMLVQYESTEAAIKARENMHNTQVNGKSICVQFANPKLVIQPEKLTYIDTSDARVHYDYA